MTTTIIKPHCRTVGTCDLFWDCECEHNYIHNKDEVLLCSFCLEQENDRPDARCIEVICAGLCPYYDSDVKALCNMFD